MEIILITPEKLSYLLRAELSRLQGIKPEVPLISDRCDFKEALKFINEQGLPISKSQFYKCTSLKQVPFNTFGRKLIFSRKKLLAWIETKTICGKDTSNIDLLLARSARKKKGVKNA